MADRQMYRSRPTNGHYHSPSHTASSGQAMGFLTLAVSAGILLLLTGATVTAAALALVVCAPVILLTSPVWVPLALVVFSAAAALLSLCAAAAGLVWGYRYMRGLHPPGSERVDYARSKIYDTAAGYLHIKLKDAAPAA